MLPCIGSQIQVTAAPAASVAASMTGGAHRGSGAPIRVMRSAGPGVGVRSPVHDPRRNRRRLGRQLDTDRVVNARNIIDGAPSRSRVRSPIQMKCPRCHRVARTGDRCASAAFVIEDQRLVRREELGCAHRVEVRAAGNHESASPCRYRAPASYAALAGRRDEALVPVVHVPQIGIPPVVNAHRLSVAWCSHGRRAPCAAGRGCAPAA